ncbi:MAG: hypothetical protein U0793_32365 [Gemmataceae bacterium]
MSDAIVTAKPTSSSQSKRAAHVRRDQIGQAALGVRRRQGKTQIRIEAAGPEQSGVQLRAAPIVLARPAAIKDEEAVMLPHQVPVRPQIREDEEGAKQPASAGEL